MIELLSPLFGKKPDEIAVTEIGARPGEKLYEELMNSEETRRSLDSENLFIVLPAFRNIYADIDYTYGDVSVKPVADAYVSSNAPFMTRDEIKRFLFEPGVLSSDMQKELLHWR
jgi:FlaA1/EpsC-like NDP-sugar epimerase